MIDRDLIDLSKLLDLMLDDCSGNVNAWMRLVEIVPDYMPPFPDAETRPKIVVRCLVDPSQPEPALGVSTHRYSYLRSVGAGWRSGGYLWDMYGDPWVSVEAALLAVLHAPVPPALVRGDIVWRDRR